MLPKKFAEAKVLPSAARARLRKPALTLAERTQFLAALDVPDADAAVPGAGNQRFAVRREGQTHDVALVAGQSADIGLGAFGRHVPQANGRILAARGQRLAVGRQGEALHGAGVSAPPGPFLARQRIPEPDDAVLAGRGDEAAVGFARPLPSQCRRAAGAAIPRRASTPVAVGHPGAVRRRRGRRRFPLRKPRVLLLFHRSARSRRHSRIAWGIQPAPTPRRNGRKTDRRSLLTNMACITPSASVAAPDEPVAAPKRLPRRRRRLARRDGPLGDGRGGQGGGQGHAAAPVGGAGGRRAWASRPETVPFRTAQLPRCLGLAAAFEAAQHKWLTQLLGQQAHLIVEDGLHLAQAPPRRRDRRFLQPEAGRASDCRPRRARALSATR